MWTSRVPAKGFCIAAILVAGSATAESVPDGSGITRSTPDLRAHLSQRLDFRADLAEESGPATGFHGDSTTHRVDGMSSRVLMDWRFNAAGLRLTGGAFHDGERQDRAALALGQDREPRQLLRSDANWRPYLGLGWDSAIGQQDQLDIQLDMGLMFRSMESRQGVAAEGEARLLNGNAFLNQEFESFRYQPTISADLEYRF